MVRSVLRPVATVTATTTTNRAIMLRCDDDEYKLPDRVGVRVRVCVDSEYTCVFAAGINNAAATKKATGKKHAHKTQHNYFYTYYVAFLCAAAKYCLFEKMVVSTMTSQIHIALLVIASNWQYCWQWRRRTKSF